MFPRDASSSDTVRKIKYQILHLSIAAAAAPIRPVQHKTKRERQDDDQQNRHVWPPWPASRFSVLWQTPQGPFFAPLSKLLIVVSDA
jgi:hypothetical protein